jgi:fatty-acid desaturase
MSELDRLKEQLAYLKFWQGIMVVTDISLVGWLVSTADSARALTVVLAIIGIISLTVGIVVLHRQIEHRINQIGRL